MGPFNSYLLIVGALLLVAFFYAVFYSKDLVLKNPFLDRNLLQKGMDKPVIWLYYDTSDVSSRDWYDFGARSSRALNIPFLNLCYESIVHQNKDQYRIEVIGGLSGAAELLGGWEQLPPGLRDPIAPVNEAERNYLRVAILAKYGGLWLEPYCVCLKPFGKLPEDKTVFFGTDLEETYAGSAGTNIPGFRAIWTPKAEHAMFKEWAAVCYDRVAKKRGGDQIRGDVKWDFVRFSNEYVQTGLVVDPAAEGMRKKNGKRIQLEDLLASNTDGKLPFDLCAYTTYVPFPWTELRDREMFGWFLRMSESQIMESDLAVKYLLKKSLKSSL
jgi:hypothetical protein